MVATPAWLARPEAIRTTVSSPCNAKLHSGPGRSDRPSIRTRSTSIVAAVWWQTTYSGRKVDQVRPRSVQPDASTTRSPASRARAPMARMDRVLAWLPSIDVLRSGVGVDQRPHLDLTSRVGVVLNHLSYRDVRPAGFLFGRVVEGWGRRVGRVHGS